MTDAVTVPQPLSFSSVLRGSTRAEHERIVAALRLPERIRAEADLVRLLIAWDTVWAEVRVGVQRDRRPAGHDERARLLVSAVRAVQRIRADLDELGYAAPWVGPDDEPRRIEPGGDLTVLLASEPGVWAVSYVLRGSRMGGPTIAAMIGERLELPHGVASAYHCDDAAGPSWILFRRRLDAWGRMAREVEREHALTAARAAFLLIGGRLTAALPAVGRTA